MKNLITASACVMLLLAFVSQFAQNQVIYQQILAANDAVDVFDEMVKAESCISPKNEKRIKERLGDILKCEQSEIIVEELKSTGKVDPVVMYQIRFPIKKILAAPKFWGIDEAENRGSYLIEREVVCE